MRDIYLIGPRGSGKSSVGLALAASGDRDFIDLDELALQLLGADSVTEVFASHGEPAWRRAEVDALRSLVGTASGRVIALGGGTVTIDDARNLLEIEQQAGRAIVVYLRARVDTLETRLGADAGDRPALTPAGTVGELDAILGKRAAVYEGVADLAVDTDDVSVAELVTRLDAVR